MRAHTHMHAFDTLAYANKLKKAGFESSLATHQERISTELRDVRCELRKLRNEFERAKFQAEMKAMERRMLLKFGGVMVVSFIWLGILLHYFQH